MLARARLLAEKVCTGAPLAIAAYKEVLCATEGLPLAEGYQVMRGQACPTYHKMRTSQDFKEGPRAFAETRAPRSQGRSPAP